MEFNAMEASAKECLAYYQAKLDEEAWEAKKNGKLVCWSASVAPPEFCVAMVSLWFILNTCSRRRCKKSSMGPS